MTTQMRRIGLLLLLCLMTPPRLFCQETDLPLFKNLNERTDELAFEHLLKISTLESELFRQSLLANSNRNAELLAIASERFRQSETLASFSKQSQYKPSRFSLTQSEFIDAINGNRQLLDPVEFYGSFEGNWFGRWADNDVDHHWGKYTPLQPGKRIEINEVDSVKLQGYQYAWVGDGYGINHVVSSADGKQNFLLGYVVHIRDQDPEQETARRPHVGLIDGPDRLIWITKGEVFLEEMIRGETANLDRYFITGFRYSIADETLSATEAFQTVYSRDANHREVWRGVEIDLKVQALRKTEGSEK